MLDLDELGNGFSEAETLAAAWRGLMGKIRSLRDAAALDAFWQRG
jgi:hypothetical protein